MARTSDAVMTLAGLASCVDEVLCRPKNMAAVRDLVLGCLDAEVCVENACLDPCRITLTELSVLPPFVPPELAAVPKLIRHCSEQYFLCEGTAYLLTRPPQHGVSAEPALVDLLPANSDNPFDWTDVSLGPATRNPLPPGQTATFLAALHAMHCPSVEHVVPHESGPAAQMSPAEFRRAALWEALLFKVRGLGEFAVPWFELQFRRFEQIVLAALQTPNATNSRVENGPGARDALSHTASLPTDPASPAIEQLTDVSENNLVRSNSLPQPVEVDETEEEQSAPSANRPVRDPGRPSQDRQNDIRATIINARVPLQRPELVEAMKLKVEGKLGAHLAWMVKTGILVNIPSQGYWPTSHPVPT